MSHGSGIHHGISFTDYLSGALSSEPLLSAGTAATLIEECPRAAFWNHPKLNPAAPRKVSKEMDIGTICHSILLEGDTSKVAVINPEDHPNETGTGFAKGWTNKSIKKERDMARELGLIPILKDDFAEIHAMVQSAQEFIAGSEISDIWPDSDREATLLWDESGIWLCGRPDALSKDRHIVVDVKTTAGSANPEAWGRTQIEGHNELQAALGVRGLRLLCPELRVEPRYIWLVVSQTAPFLCSLVAPDPAAVALANDKMEAAIALWRECMASGKWPGYSSRIHWISPPAWALARWEERAPQSKPFTEQELEHGIPL